MQPFLHWLDKIFFIQKKCIVWLVCFNATLHKTLALKKILTVISVMFFGSLAYGQTSLSFCTFVNTASQECVFDNTKFITSPDSTHAKIYLMMHGNQLFGTAKLTFKLYAIDRFDKEVYINTVIQDVQPEWMNSWQPAIFNSPGKYMVKVYRDDGTMIVTKGFEFFNY